MAKALSRLNSHWNDETLFQEAKRIVIAEYQHIVFKEWLPLVLGMIYNGGYSNINQNRIIHFHDYCL